MIDFYNPLKVFFMIISWQIYVKDQLIGTKVVTDAFCVLTFGDMLLFIGHRLIPLDPQVMAVTSGLPPLSSTQHHMSRNR